MTVPGWLVWTASGIANEIVKDEETKTLLKLAKKVKRLRFMVAEENNPFSQTEINGLVNHLHASSFEDLILVRDKGTSVNLLVKEQGEKLKDLVIIVSEEDTFAYLTMKSNLKPKDLAEVVQFFLNQEKQEEQQNQEATEEQEPWEILIPIIPQV